MLVSTVTAITSGAGVPRRAAVSLRRIVRGAHHCGAAARVNVDHPDAQRCRRRDRRGDGVGNVVVLEIEEHAVAALGERADRARSFGGEQPAADLEAADAPAKRIGQFERAVVRFDVERD